MSANGQQLRALAALPKRNCHRYLQNKRLGNKCYTKALKLTQDGGKVVSLTHRPPLPPGNTPGTHFY